MMLLIVCLGLSVFGMQVATSDMSYNIDRMLDNSTKFQKFLADITGGEETCCRCAGLLPAGNVSTLDDFNLEMKKYESVMDSLNSEMLTYIQTTEGNIYKTFEKTRNEFVTYNASLWYELDLLQQMINFPNSIAHLENLQAAVATADVCQLNHPDAIYNETYGVIGKFNTLLENWKSKE